ncbi:MAG: membrane protein insertase YidC [Candidatus Omnitrophica bacterium]|nr:membrane protein insertase YidC [Candidatus Omnitrophota bacterium]
MEKRVLLAALLSAALLAWYAKALSVWYPALSPQPQPPSQARPSPAAPEPVMRAAEPAIFPLEEEDAVTIRSSDLVAELGASSGAVRQVTLKRFLDETGRQPLQIGGNLELLHLRFGQGQHTWRLLDHSEQSATFLVSSDGNSYHITYAINHGNHSIYIIPRGTSLLSLSERYFCQSIKAGLAPGEVTLLPSPEGTVAAEIRIPLNQLQAGAPTTVASAYFGARDYFELQKAGLSDAFPIGALGQIGLILLAVLSFIAGLTKSYGVAIILFSVAMTCAMAPFTVLSFKSMKKMQELKPEIDRLMAQHKSDPAKANKAVFELYKQHRISPLSGCLPMVLQMPIFIAMFQAISHFIELRGRSFLWIKDLSLPDRAAQLPFSIPLIGNEFNALPIVMALVMYVQTRMSQGGAGQSQSNPAMKMMSGPTMSIVFGIMFYQFPSGLVLYWLMNSVTSLVWYKLAK